MLAVVAAWAVAYAKPLAVARFVCGKDGKVPLLALFAVALLVV